MVWQKYVQVSEHFAEVLKKMLEASVRHRYQSATDIMRALDLEPYIDTLAQGLATQPTCLNKGINSQSFYSGDLSLQSSPSAPSSATTKLAMAIRARRARKDQSAAAPLNLLFEANEPSLPVLSFQHEQMGHQPSLAAQGCGPCLVANTRRQRIGHHPNVET